MKPTPHSEHWNEGLKLVSYCPVCETRYLPMEARMLGRDGETHLLHVQCRKCQHAILAFVLVNRSGASSVGLLTDLSYEDVLAFRSNSAVSLNDVIDSHAFLRGDTLVAKLGLVRRKPVRQVRKKVKKLKDS